jgi:hypothetical protein
MVGSELFTGGLAPLRADAASAEPAVAIRTPAMATSKNVIRLMGVPLCSTWNRRAR